MGPKEYLNKSISLSVDYIEDFILVEKVFKELILNNEFFRMEEIINLFEKKPEFKEINKGLHNGFERW